MPVAGVDARADLRALCDRGLDWHIDTSRLLRSQPTARRAAVLVLFGRSDARPGAASAGTATADAAAATAHDLDVLLLRRADTLGAHPGQIAFPGGRIEASDADATAAALREAVEETGLDVGGIQPLGTLPALAVPVSNHLVTPVAAWWDRPSPVAAVDSAETSEVFRMPVGALLDPRNRVVTAHRAGTRTFRAPAFAVGDRLVWGFTAIVLSRIFDELGWAVPWDHGTTVRPW